jgi:hypothetical protein
LTQKRFAPFLVDHVVDRSSESIRLLSIALRSFLRFLVVRGEIARDLSGALNARAKRFDLRHRLNTTLDYCMTSQLESTHFGRHEFTMTFKRAAIIAWELIANPNWLQSIIWFRLGIWQWQFKPDVIERSDMVHWWLVFERAEDRVGTIVGAKSFI